MAAISIKVDYLKSIPGILKMIEIFLLLLAFSCMANYCGGGRCSFFLAVAIIGWLLMIAIFVCFLFNLTEQIPQLNWNAVVLITSIVWAVLLLISSALMADTVSGYRRLGHTTYYGLYTSWWDTMTAAVVFGFFSMIVFIIDGFMHLKSFMSGGGGGSNAGDGGGGKVANNQPV